MAAITFFLATSASRKRLSRQELRSCPGDLLREGHLQLPAVILQGTAASEVRGDAYTAASQAGTLLDPADCIIPNEPIAMLRLAQALREGFEEERAVATLRYYGRDKTAFFEALEQVALHEQDVCICFPRLNPYLDRECF
jgi:hypothetical protein